MSDFILSLITFPGLIILIYVIGLINHKIKIKVKLYSIGFFIFFLLSLPIFSKIISYPLSHLPKYLFKNSIATNINTSKKSNIPTVRMD